MPIVSRVQHVKGTLKMNIILSFIGKLHFSNSKKVNLTKSRGLEARNARKETGGKAILTVFTSGVPLSSWILTASVRVCSTV